VMGWDGMGWVCHESESGWQSESNCIYIHAHLLTKLTHLHDGLSTVRDLVTAMARPA
jgi:hypothetical protein